MYPFYGNDYFYSAVETCRNLLEPARFVALKNKNFYNRFFSNTQYGRSVAASFEMFERITREYSRPEFGITKITTAKGEHVKIKQKILLKNSFCNLVHFEKEGSHKLPKMLVVAPLSGHYATLLRGTVQSLLPHFDVYITDWVNAREVPLEEGFFTFDNFVSYLKDFFAFLAPNLNVMAVCQPSVPVIAAIALMSQVNDKNTPASMTLIGGPIDTRKSPTEVNDYASDRTIGWFESNVVSKVPINYKGSGRSVYPGFLQLFGFMAMNMQNHLDAHWDLFNHLVEGDGESVESHKKFYNEYLSVMDLPAEFYLQTIDIVFKKHSLPRKKLICNGKLVDLDAINNTSLLCIEGEKDDISGIGQTKAAIDLCKNIPSTRKKYHLQKDVGHYGTFNGRRYREHIVPLIVDFVNKGNS